MRSVAIPCLLILHLTFWPAMAQTPASENLLIIPLEGEGTVNNIQQKSGHDVAVRVEDANRHPVAGATVTFTLPARGASGSFPNGGTLSTITTDGDGRAVIHGLRPNGVAGKVEIHVNASHQNQTAAATITQFNMLVQNTPVQSVKKSGGSKVLLIVLLGGAAAAGGAVAALHKGSSSSTTTGSAAAVSGITINPGTGTVGAPQ